MADNSDEARRKVINGITCVSCKNFTWAYIQQPVRVQAHFSPLGFHHHHPGCPSLPTNQGKSGVFRERRDQDD